LAQKEQETVRMCLKRSRIRYTSACFSADQQKYLQRRYQTIIIV